MLGSTTTSSSEKKDEEELDISKLPSHLKLQLLSMMNNKSSSSSAQQKKTSTATTTTVRKDITLEDVSYVRNVIDQIKTNGIFIDDHFMEDTTTVENAIDEIHQLVDQGVMKKAGIGEGVAKVIDEEHRGDLHSWLDTETGVVGKDNLTQIVHKMSVIRHAMNRVFGFELDRDSIQLSFYPGNGARYVRHADASLMASTERRITVLFYFNKDETLNGGSLKMYRCEKSMDGISNIYEGKDNEFELKPLFNRLIVFPSECYHEVMKSYSNRYALTLWIYGPKELSQIYTRRQKELTQNTIFVSICSFRDTECQHTIRDLFEKAKYPDRLRVGICWQYDTESTEEKRSLFEQFNYGQQPYANQIKEIHMSYRAAKGPCYARYLIQHHLYQKENFYLQIDSHMRFVEGWDVKCITNLQECEYMTEGSRRCVLSTYPIGYELPNRIPDHARPTLLCAKQFTREVLGTEQGTEYEMLRIASRIITTEPLLLPVPSLFWAAGFSFSRSLIIRHCKYEEWKYIFFGEEMIMLKKLIDAKYRIFAPREPIIFHLWSRDHRPSFRESSSSQTGECSVVLVNNNNKIVVDVVTVDDKETIESIRRDNSIQIMKELNLYNTTGTSSTTETPLEKYCMVSFQKREIGERAKYGNYEHVDELV